MTRTIANGSPPLDRLASINKAGWPPQFRGDRLENQREVSLAEDHLLKRGFLQNFSDSLVRPIGPLR
jgi:hypothetical protein